MNEEIGTMAGAIWHALEGNDGMTLAKLKKGIESRGARLRLGDRLAGARR